MYNGVIMSDDGFTWKLNYIPNSGVIRDIINYKVTLKQEI